MFMRNFYKLSFIISIGLFANPSCPKIMEGKASFHFPNRDTLQVAASDKSIIYWEDFSIDKGELTQFTLPSELSSCLNRVISANPSKIFGRLESNGKIYLINPSGILVGDTGTINTNEFIASTLNIKDADFLSGDKLVFSGDEKTAVINHGRIEAEDGSVYLISQHIQNFGSLLAKNDTVGLADGIEVILQPEENKKILIKAKKQRFGNIENAGHIEALKTEIKSGANPYHYAINHTGMIVTPKSKSSEKRIDIEALEGKINIAGSIKNSKGLIEINAESINLTRDASLNDADNGKIHITPGKFFCNEGTLQTLGGEISIIGKQARFLNSGLIDCCSNKGGKITAIVDLYMNKGTIKADGLIQKGGNILIHSKRNLAELSKGLISAQGFPAGNITLISNRICTSGKYNIEGSKGGNLYFQTPKLLLAAPKIFAGGKKEGGVVHFGKDDLLTNLFINPFTKLNCLKKRPGKVIVHQEKDLEYKDIASIKDFNINKKGLLGEVNSVPIPDQDQIKLTDPTYGDGTGFGTHVEMLTGGNIVVTKPDYGAATSYGAFFLFDHNTGACIDAISGSSMNDEVGYNGIIPLATGNFVVLSPKWNNGGSAASAGAVTFGYADTGVQDPTVSATNSLVGTSPDDRVGARTVSSANVTALNNGDYVVCSPYWDNGAVDVGAATFSPGNGMSGMVGPVSAGNSLIGTIISSRVGIGNGSAIKQGGAVELSNGHFVVVSYRWSTGAASSLGAVTWADGTTATMGTVGTGNSVIGSVTGDVVGISGIIPLSQGSTGNFVIGSGLWSGGSTPSAGAATWVNGSTGSLGVVGTSNSLHGVNISDQISRFGWIALEDGNYVILSQNWNNGLASDAGAATWGDGVSGTTGPVGIGNSLYGTQTGDLVGQATSSTRAIALQDGKYVVTSSAWDNGPTSNAGAVTWVDGMTANAVSVSNSIYGVSTNDFIGGTGIFLLKGINEGDFVVASASWDNGTTANAGAVTWGNGAYGTTGAVSVLNSIYGNTNDFVGNGGIVPLSNGKFVVISRSWNNAGAGAAGAVTLVDPNESINFPVTTDNSLHGSSASDKIGSGGVIEIFGNQYIVASPDRMPFGAVTCGDASQNPGIIGPVSQANSLIGTSTDDFAGVNVNTTVTFNSTTEKYAIGFPSGDNLNGKVILFGVGGATPISQLAEDKDILNFYRAISEAGQQWNFWPRPNIQSTMVNIPPFGSQTFWYMNNIKTSFEVHEKEE